MSCRSLDHQPQNGRVAYDDRVYPMPRGWFEPLRIAGRIANKSNQHSSLCDRSRAVRQFYQRTVEAIQNLARTALWLGGLETRRPGTYLSCSAPSLRVRQG